ncbi:hypothetical protein BH11PLA2_BH11PLA2_37760 [soil metagenome]
MRVLQMTSTLAGLLMSVMSSSAAPPVAAPDLTKSITLTLPSPPDDAVLASKGRYLAFTCPAAKQIAVVDVTKGEVAKLLPMNEADQRVAGTLTKLFVFSPQSRTMQAYKVDTWAEDGKAKPLPKGMPTDGVGTMVAAPTVDSLIMLQFPKSKSTIGYYPYGTSSVFGALNWKHFGPTNAWGPAEMRLSHNGTLLVGFGGGFAGLEAAILRNNRAEVWDDQYKFGPIDWAMPSADGQFLYTPHGHLTRTMTFIGGQKKDQPFAFATIDSGFYLTSETDALVKHKSSPTNVVPPRNRFTSGKMPKLTLYSADNQKIASVNDDTLDVALDLPPDKRAYFYHFASMLVTVGGADKKTVKLQALNTKAELDKTGGDYLIVASTPTAATRNARYSYPLEVLSKKGGVKVKLDRGHASMKVVGTTLIWDVPGEVKEKEVEFQLSITDASDKKILHTGRIAILSPK